MQVKIDYPLVGHDPEARVEDVLSRFPLHSPHEKVAAALAAIDAKFGVDADGQPAWYGVYD